MFFKKKITGLVVAILASASVFGQVVYEEDVIIKGNHSIRSTEVPWNSGTSLKLGSHKLGVELFDENVNGLSPYFYVTKFDNEDWTPLFKVSSNGRIGIGTDNPDARLEIRSSDYTAAKFRRDGGGGVISLYETTYNNHQYKWHNGLSYQGDFMITREGHSIPDFGIYFGTGRVGLGTDNPDARLEIRSSEYTAAKFRRDGGGGVVSLYETTYKGSQYKWHSGLSYQGDFMITRELEADSDKLIDFVVYDNGSVGIGTGVSDTENYETLKKEAKNYKLAVKGKIICEGVRVKIHTEWPDYVFQPEYELKSLETVEQHIEEKGHLPNIPSQENIQENGIELNEMQRLQMEKIEELTLYLIEQNKQLKAQNQKIEALEMQLQTLTK